MIFNLTENAVRYTRRDSVINISIVCNENDVQIRVRDNGHGIPEQYRESIFQPFFRVDKARSREHGGVGLGLALVWEIAALHGGSVRVEDCSEAGTVMLVTLPKSENKRTVFSRRKPAKIPPDGKTSRGILIRIYGILFCISLRCAPNNSRSHGISGLFFIGDPSGAVFCRSRVCRLCADFPRRGRFRG